MHSFDFNAHAREWKIKITRQGALSDERAAIPCNCTRYVQALLHPVIPRNLPNLLFSSSRVRRNRRARYHYNVRITTTCAGDTFRRVAIISFFFFFLVFNDFQRQNALETIRRRVKSQFNLVRCELNAAIFYLHAVIYGWIFKTVFCSIVWFPSTRRRNKIIAETPELSRGCFSCPKCKAIKKKTRDRLLRTGKNMKAWSALVQNIDRRQYTAIYNLLLCHPGLWEGFTN